MTRAMSLSILLFTSAIAAAPAAAQGHATPQPTTPEPTPAPEPAPEPTPAPESAPAAEPAAPATPAEPAPPAEPAAAEGEAAEPPAGIEYDKGFTLSSGDEKFELKINLRSQIRLEVSKPDASEEWVAAFVIPRLRLQLEGFAYGKANTYKVELDVASRGNPSLKDAFLEHDFSGIRLRGGQWKRPFTRHQMASDFGLHFLESSIQGRFATDNIVRDLGVAVHNGYDKSPDGIEWVAGLFNGAGEAGRQRITCPAPDLPGDPIDPATCTIGAPSNVPADYDPVFTARVGYNHGGIKGYQEGDVEGGPLRFAVAAAYKLDFNNFTKNADDAAALGHAVSLDALLKVAGFALSGAVAVVGVADANPDTDAELGFFADAGYFVVPKHLELAARYGNVPTPSNFEERDQEILGALNYYVEQHNFKLMLDSGVITHSGNETATDLQIRTQAQMVF